MWRELPRDGLIPLRSSFHPERAGRLLSNVMLIEVTLGTAADGSDTTTRIRLLGSAVREFNETNVTGLDYLDFVPDRAFQARHLRTCLLYPCGAWSLTPSVYDRGYSRLIEVTKFPLINDVSGKHLMLSLMLETRNDLSLEGKAIKTIEMHPAIAKNLIDIGAGIPIEELNISPD